jgi:hypothetical protein
MFIKKFIQKVVNFFKPEEIKNESQSISEIMASPNEAVLKELERITKEDLNTSSDDNILLDNIIEAVSSEKKKRKPKNKPKATHVEELQATFERISKPSTKAPKKMKKEVEVKTTKTQKKK